MGNENKRGIKDKLTSGLKKAGDVADGAGVSAKTAAGKIASQAVKAKSSVDKKVRAALDEAYEVKRKEAIDNVARLRQANPELSPKEIIGVLEKGLKAADEKSSDKSEAFSSAASIYVLSVVEVHGASKKSNRNRQKLIDVVVAFDSRTTKTIAAVGGFALTILAKRFGPVARALKAAAKLGGKAALVAPVIALAGIKNPGKKGAAWAVVAATEKLLGEPPKSWPKVEAPKTAAAKSLKAAKPKSTAK